jgi:hypothetical protein
MHLIKKADLVQTEEHYIYRADVSQKQQPT